MAAFDLCDGINYVSSVIAAGGGRMAWNTAFNYCYNQGTRLPTPYELGCLCLNKNSVPAGFNSTMDATGYWSSDAEANGSHILMDFDDCKLYYYGSGGANDGGITNYVKCVK
jgi:hypothetical protein